jgi:hypothetical protein
VRLKVEKDNEHFKSFVIGFLLQDGSDQQQPLQRARKADEAEGEKHPSARLPPSPAPISPYSWRKH